MTESTVFVLYRLSIPSLPVLAIARLLFRDTRFVLCTRAAKRWFPRLVLGLGCRQIVAHELYQGGTHAAAHRGVIEIGRALARHNLALPRAFAAFGGDERYSALADQIFSETWFAEAFVAGWLRRFAEKEAANGRRVLVLTRRPEDAFHADGAKLENVSFVRWHRPLVALGRVAAGCAIAFAFILFPLANALYLWRKGIRFRRAGGKVPLSSKHILFVHRFAHMAPQTPAARNMFFLRSGIMPIGACAHLCMATSESFDGEKRSYLGASGGDVVDLKDVALSWNEAWRLLFADYARHLLPALIQVALGRYGRVRFLSQTVEYLHLLAVARAVLANLGCRVVYFETEASSLGRAMGLEARRAGMRSFSMPHGSGAHLTTYINRANLTFDGLLVPGDDHSLLRKINPVVTHFQTIANHEALRGATGENILPEAIRRKRRGVKVVGLIMSLHDKATTDQSLFDVRPSFESVLMDDAVGANFCRTHLKPLLDWIAARDDVVLLWKSKPGTAAEHENHPWIRELLAIVPPERLIVRSDHPLMDAIMACDACLISALSSVGAAALSHRIPAVSWDVYYGGAERRLHPLLAAETGAELVSHLARVLVEDLPESVYAPFVASADPDYTTLAQGVRALTESLDPVSVPVPPHAAAGKSPMALKQRA